MLNETVQRRLKDIFLISGIYDLTDLRTTSINTNNLLALNDDNVAALSPITFDWYAAVNDNGGAIHIFVGENDSPTFIRQSRALHRRLEATTKIPTKYALVPECDHYDIVEHLCRENYQITKTIRENI